MFADRVARHREQVRIRTASGDGREETVGNRNVQTENGVHGKEGDISTVIIFEAASPPPP